MTDFMKTLKRHFVVYFPFYGLIYSLIIVGSQSSFNNPEADTLMVHFTWGATLIVMAATVKLYRAQLVVFRRALALIGILATSILFPKLFKFAYTSLPIALWLSIFSTLGLWGVLLYALNLRFANEQDKAACLLLGKKFLPYFFGCSISYFAIGILIRLYERQRLLTIQTKALQAFLWKVNIFSDILLGLSIFLLLYVFKRILRSCES